MNITDSPSTISPPQTTTTTTTTTTSTTTTTTTANQKNQFDHFLDPHSSAGRGDIDPYIDGSPSYVYDERPENDLVFGVMTSAGYFFITIVLMIAPGYRSMLGQLVFLSHGRENCRLVD